MGLKYQTEYLQFSTALSVFGYRVQKGGHSNRVSSVPLCSGLGPEQRGVELCIKRQETVEGSEVGRSLVMKGFRVE